jgi:hypothetical protein
MTAYFKKKPNATRRKSARAKVAGGRPAKSGVGRKTRAKTRRKADNRRRL